MSIPSIPSTKLNSSTLLGVCIGEHRLLYGLRFAHCFRLPYTVVLQQRPHLGVATVAVS